MSAGWPWAKLGSSGDNGDIYKPRESCTPAALNVFLPAPRQTSSGTFKCLGTTVPSVKCSLWLKTKLHRQRELVCLWGNVCPVVDLNEVQVELFASKEQHMMQLYCLRYLNNAYRFYWRSMGLCHANPPFPQLAKVLIKIALKGARVVIITKF